jgi:transketolase
MGPGLTYGNDGPTHHATEDVGVLRCLPNLSIFNPCDVVAVGHSVNEAYNSGGPCYIRLDKEQNIPLWEAVDAATTIGFKILNEGSDTLVISTGVITFQVREAMEDKNITHIDVLRLKPINSRALIPLLSSYKRIIVVDEHVKAGSLFSTVAELMVENGIAVKLESVTLPSDNFLLGSATRAWAHKEFGFSIEALKTLFFNGP